MGNNSTATVSGKILSSPSAGSVGRRIVGMALGFLLIAAAMMKALSISLPDTNASFLSVILPPAAVMLEFGLGATLIVGIAPRVTWPAALAMFTMFAGYSLRAIVDGRTSCGCFGATRLDPRVTLAIDVGAAVALLSTACRGQLRERQFGSFGSLKAFAGAVLIVVASGVAGWMASGSATIAGSVRSGELVVLQPEQWIGNRFPLLDSIDIGNELAHGNWKLLLYHHDCPKCKAVLAAFDRLEPNVHQKLAVIEVPPHANDPGLFTKLKHGHLSRSKDWFVVTPAGIDLAEGQVIRTFASVDEVGRNNSSY